MAVKTYTYESNQKTRNQVKADIISDIYDMLCEKYGENNIAWVRTGTDKSQSNAIGIKYGDVDKDGDILPVTVCVDALVKEFENRSTAKKDYVAFDFDAAVERYQSYIEKKELNAQEAAEKKKAKIAKDEARRKTEAKSEDF